MRLNAFLIHATEGGYVSFDPETGTTGQDDTAEEGLANLKEACELYLAMLTDGALLADALGVW